MPKSEGKRVFFFTNLPGKLLEVEFRYGVIGGGVDFPPFFRFCALGALREMATNHVLIL
jgi:hypothetical protein